MYETALPEETQQTVLAMEPAEVVVGITSYRNPDTIEEIVRRVGTGLAGFFRHLNPVLVNVDGHSSDDTLDRAGIVGTPAPIRHILTRYQGFPGRGSAVRAVFEIATLLEARAVVLLEADVVSFDKQWLPVLLGPVLAGEVEFALPRFDEMSPPSLIEDWIAYPLFETLFGVTLRNPMPGQVAMAGSVASYFANCDVWETDIARHGVDIWMTGEATLRDEITIGEISLSYKKHTSAELTETGPTAFLHEVSTLFRLAYHYRHYWQRQVKPPVVHRLNLRATGSVEPNGIPPRQAFYLEKLYTYDNKLLRRQWQHALSNDVRSRVQKIMNDAPAQLPAPLWARVVYDFMTEYHQGDGDPDKVVKALYPIFLARCASVAPLLEKRETYEAGLREQKTAFQTMLPYLREQWQAYAAMYQ